MSQSGIPAFEEVWGERWWEERGRGWGIKRARNEEEGRDGGGMKECGTVNSLEHVHVCVQVQATSTNHLSPGTQMSSHVSSQMENS